MSKKPKGYKGPRGRVLWTWRNGWKVVEGSTTHFRINQLDHPNLPHHGPTNRRWVTHPADQSKDITDVLFSKWSERGGITAVRLLLIDDKGFKQASSIGYAVCSMADKYDPEVGYEIAMDRAHALFFAMADFGVGKPQ